MYGYLRRGLAGVLFAMLPACAGEPISAAAPSAQVRSEKASSTPPQEPLFEARAVGPLTNATPLQIVSVFPYEPGETMITPALEIAGFLADARMRQGFGADPLRVLLVSPTPSTIKAGQLLAIAWGPRAAFSLARAGEMGHAAMREAIARNVEEMAYAPIARDQGVTSVDADVVAAAFVEGATEELIREERAAPAKVLALKRVIYEAGPNYVAAVTKAVARGVLAGHARAAK